MTKTSKQAVEQNSLEGATIRLVCAEAIKVRMEQTFQPIYTKGFIGLAASLFDISRVR